MTDAPERIWIEDEFGEGHEDRWEYGCWDRQNILDYCFPYVRADLHEALQAELASGSFYKESDIDQLQDRIAKLEEDNRKLRKAVNQARLSLAGYISEKVAINAIDSLTLTVEEEG